MEKLCGAAEKARVIRGQVMAVVAEPSVSKLRLLYEFMATSQSGWMLLDAVSLSHEASAYILLVICPVSKVARKRTGR